MPTNPTAVAERDMTQPKFRSYGRASRRKARSAKNWKLWGWSLRSRPQGVGLYRILADGDLGDSAEG